MTRYGILAIIAAALIAVFYFSGGWKTVKKISNDCLIDHSTGRYTINNVARFFTLWCFLFLYVITHINVVIKPKFGITTIPFSEWEMLVVLGFIVGAEAIKKLPNSKPINPPQETI